MRIIAGEFKGRRLLSPPETAQTRPVPSRVRESLFLLLRGHFAGASVYDAFAGTGSFGLEALSRGASRCVFVEQDRTMSRVLEKNIGALGVGERAEVFTGDALGAGALARCPRPATIIMFDPPYDLAWDALGWRRIKGQFESLVERLSEDGYAILRTPWPFFHLRNAEGEVVPARVRKEQSRPARERPRRWRSQDLVELERGRGSRPEAEEDFPEPEPERAGLKREKVDLTMRTGIGPETHVYGRMGVHLYMRRRG